MHNYPAQCSIIHNLPAYSKDFAFSLLGSILNNSISIDITFTWNIIDVSGNPWSTLSIEKQAKIEEYFQFRRNNVSVSIFVPKPIDKESLLDFIGVSNNKFKKC